MPTVNVFIAGILFSLQGFPCKTLYFPVQDCSVRLLQEIPNASWQRKEFKADIAEGAIVVQVTLVIDWLAAVDMF